MMNLRDMKWTMTLVPFAEAQKTHYKGDPFKHDYFSLGSLLWNEGSKCNICLFTLEFHRL